MTDRALSEIRNVFVAAAIEAGNEIRAVYDAGCDVGFKGDGSPITEADTRAEAAVLRVLGGQLADLPIVAEEQCARGTIPNDLGDRFVLVDPLDGTKEFVKRNDEFSVLIGLVDHGRPVVGVIHAPVTGLIWAGIVGVGAWTGRPDAAGHVRDWTAISVREAREPWAVLVSRSHGTSTVDAILDRLPVGTRTPLGSALKFAAIAEGRADLHFRFLGTCEWDTAAGEALVTAAGGAVYGLDGAPIAYGKRIGVGERPFANPGYVVSGTVPRARVLAAIRAVTGEIRS